MENNIKLKRKTISKPNATNKKVKKKRSTMKQINLNEQPKKNTKSEIRKRQKSVGFFFISVSLTQ